MGFKSKILGRAEVFEMFTEKSYMEIVNDFYPIKAELRIPPCFHQLLELCNALSVNCFPQSTNQRPGHTPENQSVINQELLSSSR